MIIDSNQPVHTCLVRKEGPQTTGLQTTGVKKDSEQMAVDSKCGTTDYRTTEEDKIPRAKTQRAPSFEKPKEPLKISPQRRRT